MSDDILLTDNARLMLDHAPRRASDRGWRIDDAALFLLWSLLRWELKIGIVLLEKCGVELKILEEDLARILDSKVVESRSPPGLQTIDSVVNHAIQLAGELRTDYVGTEHFVLAMLMSSNPDFQKLFALHQIDGELYTKKFKEFFETD